MKKICLFVIVMLNSFYFSEAFAASIAYPTGGKQISACASKTLGYPQNLRQIVTDPYCCSAVGAEQFDCLMDNIKVLWGVCLLVQAQVGPAQNAINICTHGGVATQGCSVSPTGPSTDVDDLNNDIDRLGKEITSHNAIISEASQLLSKECAE